jgi:hypothetical protein
MTDCWPWRQYLSSILNWSGPWPGIVFGQAGQGWLGWLVPCYSVVLRCAGAVLVCAVLVPLRPGATVLWRQPLSPGPFVSSCATASRQTTSLAAFQFSSQPVSTQVTIPSSCVKLLGMVSLTLHSFPRQASVCCGGQAPREQDRAGFLC